jgi:uncharacterized protein YciI
MALYVLVCKDKPDALALRMATRPAHLAYAGAHSGKVKLGGPILDAKGDMAGSLLVFDTDDVADVQAFTDNDPYTLAGLFGSVEILPFKASIGTLG